MDPEPRAARKGFTLNNWQVLLLILVIVAGRLVIDFSQRIVEGQQKAAEEEALRTEIARLEQEQRELLAAKAYYSSSAFVEAWAHDEGKMVREGEVLVVPGYDLTAIGVGPGSSGGSPQSIQAQPWQAWWQLFFDETPPETLNNP